MSPALHDVLTYVAIPVIAAIAGGVVSAFFTPGPKLKSSIQHFAAGLVFAAVSTGLLPEMLRPHNLSAVMVGFSTGVVLMIGVKWLNEGRGQKRIDQPASLNSLVFTAGVDYLMDGLLIGIGFVLGAKVGGLLVFALSIEGLFLAIAVTSALNRKGVACSRLIITAAIFGLLLGVGAIAGALIFARLSGAFYIAMLAFGSAALIYLVTEELLVEAHDQQVQENPLTAGLFFAGFLLLIIIEMSV
jgi:zinc transporter, ZIP family